MLVLVGVLCLSSTAFGLGGVGDLLGKGDGGLGSKCKQDADCKEGTHTCFKTAILSFCLPDKCRVRPQPPLPCFWWARFFVSYID